MIKSRLISILQTCSRKELRDLGKWIQSPAHNQRQDVIDLYNYLVEDGHLYNSDLLVKEDVYRRIFDKEGPYDDDYMRQVMHFFSKTLEEFLIYQEVSQDRVRAKTALARVYRKKRLDKAFEKNMRTTRSLQGKQSLRDGTFLRNEYLLEQEQYTYLSTFKRTDLNLQEMSDALDRTYIADKLRQSCHMLSHQTVYKTDYHIGLLEEVMDYVETQDLFNIPAIAIYYYGFKTSTERDNVDHFFKLREQIDQHGHLFSSSEQRDIYLMALNYCIARMNLGDGPFMRHAFELYQTGFKEGYLIENNRVSRWTFFNMVTLSLKLEEYDWVYEFIEDFQKYLVEDHREGFVHFSKARLHYQQKDYDQAMRYLIQFDPDEIIVNLGAKNLLMKMYYELDEWDALDSLLESMRAYLVRKKVMGYHKSNYRNIIRYTKKLLKVNPFDPKEKDKITKEIETASPLTEKDWLLEQLAVAGR